jgi:YHS domain-containing protein
MNKTIITSFVVCLMLVCLLTVGCAKQAVSGGPIINKVCPVMGGSVNENTPYKVTYKGETIGFCCPSCIKSFNSNPEKYIGKIK